MPLGIARCSIFFIILPSKRNFSNRLICTAYFLFISSMNIYAAGITRAMKVASAAPITSILHPHMNRALRPMFTTQLMPALTIVNILLRWARRRAAQPLNSPMKGKEAAVM